MATEALLKKYVKLFFFSVMVGTNKLTDLLTSFIKIAISQFKGTNLKKHFCGHYLGWDVYEHTEYSKSFYFILLKRTTSWQIALFVNIYIAFVT